VQHIARQFTVAGFVRNLPDGRVQLVAEGESTELEAFLDQVATRMSEHIQSVKQGVTAASGEYSGFSIRY